MPERYAQWTDYPKRKDEGGRWCCRWCGKPLSGRRTSWCSRACEREVGIRCGHQVRRAVWLRDRGVCADCGRDTNLLRRQLRAIRKRYGTTVWRCKLSELCLSRSEARRTLWQAHHVKAVEEGGGACGIEGYKTLCLWCHKKESAKQAAQRQK